MASGKNLNPITQITHSQTNNRVISCCSLWMIVLSRGVAWSKFWLQNPNATAIGDPRSCVEIRIGNRRPLKQHTELAGPLVVLRGRIIHQFKGEVSNRSELSEHDECSIAGRFQNVEVDVNVAQLAQVKLVIVSTGDAPVGWTSV